MFMTCVKWIYSHNEYKQEYYGKSYIKVVFRGRGE